MIDERGVERWMPNQSGISVTGNRKQNFSEYRINNRGYNSYREYEPIMDSLEIAIIGDSFIEGFHQHYYNSLGKMVENDLSGIQVYEYGYGGYDLADQLHLIYAYPEEFSKIDRIVVYLKYPEDLKRGKYNVIRDRVRLQSGIYPYLKKSKLLVYAQNIGLLDAVKGFVKNAVNTLRGNSRSGVTTTTKKSEDLDQIYLENFKSLIAEYGFDKNKSVFLLDKSSLPDAFQEYLDNQDYAYIDYGEILEKAEDDVILLYDPMSHWNDLGRTLIANQIADWCRNQFK
ncbi:hypothetical protein LVD13_05695 [Flavobacteriaceae bacterium D16]|nr:hypothetical protein [Flavobacteriaceae bacterium D16]